jgi:hypothetical protein
MGRLGSDIYLPAARLHPLLQPSGSELKAIKVCILNFVDLEHFKNDFPTPKNILNFLFHNALVKKNLPLKYFQENLRTFLWLTVDEKRQNTLITTILFNVLRGNICLSCKVKSRPNR